MSDANIIDGKAIAANLRADIGRRVALLKESHGVTPGLSVVLVGEDPASEVYVRNKGKSTLEAGMNSNTYTHSASASHAEVMAKVEELNADAAVHGGGRESGVSGQSFEVVPDLESQLPGWGQNQCAGRAPGPIHEMM